MADRNRLYRGLRITASAVFGVVFLLVVVLWVRSYYTRDVLWIRYSDPRYVRISSVQGRIVVSMKDYGNSHRLLMQNHSRILRTYVYQDEYGRSPSSLWFRVLRWSTRTEVHIPDWFLVFSFATLAAVPWLPWSKRFSLRTLLIAVTLVAVGLGTVVYLVRG